MSHGVENYSRETFLGRVRSWPSSIGGAWNASLSSKRAEAHFKKLDHGMLKELLPQHHEDKQLAMRAKEARKELEEIFGREMEKDQQSKNFGINSKPCLPYA